MPRSKKEASSGFDANLDDSLALSHRGAVAAEALQLYGEALSSRFDVILQETFRKLDDGHLTSELALQRWAQLREVSGVLSGLGVTERRGAKAAERARRRITTAGPTGSGA